MRTVRCTSLAFLWRTREAKRRGESAHGSHAPHVVEQMLDLSGDSSATDNAAKVLWRLFTNDLMRWSRTRDLRKKFAAAAPDGRPIGRAALASAVRLADREMSLRQQTRMLDATHRVFRYWHVAHRPFAITALVAVVIHVVVVVAVGATWLR